MVGHSYTPCPGDLGTRPRLGLGKSLKRVPCQDMGRLARVWGKSPGHGMCQGYCCLALTLIHTNGPRLYTVIVAILAAYEPTAWSPVYSSRSTFG